MTGFARSEGTTGRYRWSWELRSVNGKGLDARLRLPPGFEALEGETRRLLGERLTRGNVQVSLTVTPNESRMEAVLNEDALSALMALRERLGPALVDPAPLRLDTLIGIRGLVDLREAEDGPAEIETRDREILSGLAAAVDALRRMREVEGATLGCVLMSHIDKIEALTRQVDDDPSRSPAEIARRLEVQISQILEAGPALDRDRLHAEVALLATKADLREELDRLKSHVAAARSLIAEGGPVGRKLDFIAQEFNRESNTICSKSNAVAVTAAGIELKVVVDQFREQLQNLE